MVKCSALMCDSASYKNTPGITLHRFPKDVHLRNAWVKNINRANWQPNGHSVLCSKHFANNLIDQNQFRTVLRSGAIPSLFKQLPASLNTPAQDVFGPGPSTIVENISIPEIKLIGITEIGKNMEQQNKEIIESVVDCVIDIKIKDEDPLSIVHVEEVPILKNINQAGFAQIIKQEVPEATTTVYHHNTVPLVTQNSAAASTSNAPKKTNSNNSSKTMNIHRSLVERKLKTFEIQQYQSKLLKCDKMIKSKTRQVKTLRNSNGRLKASNERLKQLLKKYKQKQVISEAVLKDIAKNSKLANMLLSHIMSNDN